jgi:hypothetical protein
MPNQGLLEGIAGLHVGNRLVDILMVKSSGPLVGLLHGIQEGGVGLPSRVSTRKQSRDSSRNSVGMMMRQLPATHSSRSSPAEPTWGHGLFQQEDGALASE